MPPEGKIQIRKLNIVERYFRRRRDKQRDIVARKDILKTVFAQRAENTKTIEIFKAKKSK